MSFKNDQEHYEKLIQFIKETLEKDVELREKYLIGDKFRFIRDQLNSLLQHLEQGLLALKSSDETKIETPQSEGHDVIVHVYLFNAQGMVFRSWFNMLTPKVFYEYSVNRPIYMNKKDIESFIKSKQNKLQHGYLTIAIKNENILAKEEFANLKDPMGYKLIKIKEGSISVERLVCFTHNEIDYILDSEGALVKK